MPAEWASLTGLRNLITLDISSNPLTGALLVSILDKAYGPAHCCVDACLFWCLPLFLCCKMGEKDDAMGMLMVADITGYEDT